MSKVLRPDQQDLKNRVYDDWNHGAQNILAVLSTGGGKSVISSSITLDGYRSEWQQIIMAHRNELVGQMSMHVAERGIPHRIIGSNDTVARITRQHRKKFGTSFINPSARTAVVGVDTLISRYEDLKNWLLQTTLFQTDEAHHVLVKNKWGKAAGMMPKNAISVGWTATPDRADGAGLGRDYDGIYDKMEVGIDMRSLIKIGALADYEIVCPPSDLRVDEKDIGANGDWSNQKLRKAAQKSRIVGDVVQEYCRYAFWKQAICFATDVETAGEIAQKFKSVGIPAASISAQTNPTVREKYIEEFKTGIIKVLVNVDLFDEGFDVPACEVVIMARPTASLAKYRQMVGRCLRTALGKICGLIIDHVSNVKRHGLPDRFIAWTLARRDKRAKKLKDPNDIETIVCIGCTRPYEAFHVVCPHCGLAPPLPEPRSRSIEMVAGDLILLDREKLEAMRRAAVVRNPGDVAAEAGDAAGYYAAVGAANRQREKFAAHEHLKEVMAQWAAVERENGFNDRQIHKKFYLTMGVDVLSALDGNRSRQEFEEMSQRIEGWYMK